MAPVTGPERSGRAATQSESALFRAATLPARVASSLLVVFVSFSSIVTLAILPVNLKGTL